MHCQCLKDLKVKNKTDMFVKQVNYLYDLGTKDTKSINHEEIKLNEN